MVSTGKLKKEALKDLKGNWGIAILATFIAGIITGAIYYYGAVSNVIDTINRGLYLDTLSTQSNQLTPMDGIGTLINVLVGGSISYGLCTFFLNLSRGTRSKIEDIFSGFKFFGKNFLVQILIGIYSILWSIAIYLPAIIICAIVIAATEGDLTAVIGAGIVLAIAVFCAAGVMLYIIIARYQMAFFIANDNHDLDSMQCIKSSKEMMKGHCVRYFLMNLSFIGWDILSIFTLGIGYLWLSPYKHATKSNFYLNLKGEDKDALSEAENKETLDSKFIETTTTEEN